MTPGRLAQLRTELERVYDADADQALEALKIAVLLEDTLGIVLDDDDIERLRLAGPPSVASVVARHEGPS